MAISDQDIFDWFLANPNADDATIAATMDQFKLTPEDIARATGSDLSNVQSRYNAVEKDTADQTQDNTAATKLPTFTNAIAANNNTVDTSADDLLTTLAATTNNANVNKTATDDLLATLAGNNVSDVTTTEDLLATLADNTAGNTAANTYTKNFAGQDYTLDQTAVDFLTNQILGQNLTSQWRGEGFGSPEANAKAMAENLLASGITNINQVGQIDKKVDEAVRSVYDYVDQGQTDEYGNPIKTAVLVGYVDAKGNPVDASLVKTETAYSGGEGGGIETNYLAPIGTQKVIGNKETGQQIINDYGERGVGNAFSGTYAGSGNTAYRVQFDAKGNPYFYTTGASSSDIADWGPILALASVIPSPIQPFAMAANAAISINNGDVLGGIAALAGVAGYSDVAAGARIAKAVDSGDPFAIVTSVLNSPFGTNVGNTMLTDTISLKDAGNAINVANNVSNGNYTGALTSLGQLTGSSDVQTAAAAARVAKAIASGNETAIIYAVAGLNNTMNAANRVTDKSIASSIASNVADAHSAAAEGTQLAALTNGTTSDAGNGFTLSGAGADALNLDNFSDSDSIAADTALFNSSIGDLDTTDDFLSSIGITNTDQLTDSNLSNQDILDMVNGTDTTAGGDNIDELVITGDKPTTTDTTTTDTITGGDGSDLVIDDKGEVVIKDKKESCPIGTVLNPETGECDAIEDKGEVVIKDKKESCPIGTVLNPETGECEAIEDKGEVVIKDKKESCPIGTVLNPETGECDPVEDKGEVVIKDKKESCPIGTKLNPETGECDPIEETLTCPPGKVLNDAGTACIDEVVIKDKKDFCPVGTVLNPETGECDPIVDEKITCPTGFHLGEDGKSCVPDDVKKALECPEGYEPNDDGTACIPVVTITDKKCDPGYVYDEDLKQCVPITDDTCPVGFHKDESGKCVPDTKGKLECPEGYEPNDDGTACIPVIEIKDKKCDPGYVYDEDLKMCVPVKDDTCPVGFHKDDSGTCVPDEVKCETGYHLENGVCVPDKKALECPEGYELNDAGTECIPVVVIKDKKCDPGYVYDEDLKQCVPIKDEECAEGFHLENGICVPDDDETCKDGYEKVNGVCVPVCKEGYVRNLETGACEKAREECKTGYHWDEAKQACVKDTVTPPPPPPPPPKTCPTGYVLVGDTCVPIPKTITPTTALPVDSEKIDPIYATGMDDFDLFATLEELLKENSDKTDKKKDSKKSKEKTKMATGGHLDDLLAEQMTVDDLLKLLR